MKAFSLFLTLFSFSLVTCCQSKPPGFHESYDAAKSEAESKGQLLMIDFYTDWCAPCKKIEKEVYNSTDFQEFIDNISCFKIDYETEQGKLLGEQYNVSSFPTIVFIQDGAEVERITSYNSKERHLRDMKRIISGNHTVAMEARFSEGLSYAELFHLSSYFGRRYFNLEKRAIYHGALLEHDPQFEKDSTLMLTNVLYQSQLIFGDDSHIPEATKFLLEFPNETYQAELMYRIVSHLCKNQRVAKADRLYTSFEKVYNGNTEGKKYIKQAKKLLKQ